MNIKKSSKIFTVNVAILLSLYNKVLCELVRSNEISANEIINDDNQPPEVEIDSGKLIGTFYKTAGGRKVYAFLGIPYAAPPVNELRFREPQPVVPWNDTRTVADKDYNSCLQLNHYRLARNVYGIYGDEDCLYLNVYTPKLRPTKQLLDVIVYIHGGAFMFSDGKSYAPKYILDKTDIVFVSINYRLGPFGFLSTGDHVIPGNNGLKDQVFALKWVQNNVIKFGGDRNRVTISGMSAGGASVHYHYLSKLSRNIFNQGMSLSGIATNPWALMENGKDKAVKLAEQFGCDTSNSTMILNCLQTVPGNTLLEKVKPLFMPWLYNPFSPFGPTVESSNTHEPFLSESPYALIKRGDVKRAPWLLSVAADEGLYPGAQFIINDKILNELNNNWSCIAPHLLDFNFTVYYDQHNNTSNKIRDHYLQNRSINLESSKRLVDMLSDRLFLNDIGKTIKLQASWLDNIYLYKFLFRGKYSVSDFLTQSLVDVGVSHGDDLPYALGCFFPDIHKRTEENELIQVMVNVWLSFIKSGRPIVNENVAWNPIQSLNVSNNVDYIVIKSSKDFPVKSDNNFGDSSFWSSLNIQE